MKCSDCNVSLGACDSYFTYHETILCVVVCCGRLPLSFSSSLKCSGITETLSAHHFGVQCCIRGLHTDSSLEKNSARGCVSVGILPQGAGKEDEIQMNEDEDLKCHDSIICSCIPLRFDCTALES